MKAMEKDLYQHSTYVPKIDFSFHQYLIPGEEPILVHTGYADQTRALLPRMEEVLGGRELAYIFPSHFEGDECGGLALLMERYPAAVVVCSAVTARQIAGFGCGAATRVQKPGDRLLSPSFELEFFSYPSEMHLWEGLLALERKRSVFFSADLMIRPGEGGGKVRESRWEDEVHGIGPEQVPDPERRSRLQRELREISPVFVATGHGPCVRLH